MQVSSLCEPTSLGMTCSLPHASWDSWLENLTRALDPQSGVCSLTVWYEAIYQIICDTGMTFTEWLLFFLPSRVKQSQWYSIHKVLNTMQDTEYMLRLSLIFFQICLGHNLLFIFFYLLFFSADTQPAFNHHNQCECQFFIGQISVDQSSLDN